MWASVGLGIFMIVIDEVTIVEIKAEITFMPFQLSLTMLIKY